MPSLQRRSETCCIRSCDVPVNTVRTHERYLTNTPEVTAREGIERLRAFLISIGMPKNFAELGAKAEDIPLLVHTLFAGNEETGVLRGFVQLNAEDCRKIYELMV